jgi:hypothetical protein
LRLRRQSSCLCHSEQAKQELSLYFMRRMFYISHWKTFYTQRKCLGGAQVLALTKDRGASVLSEG